MAFFDLFRRKKVHKAEGGESSPGGSLVYKYDGGEFDKPRIGYGDESTIDYVKIREKQYEILFGESVNVLHEMVPLVPHIDVYVFPPKPGGRDFYTLATSGMSDLPMNVPDESLREHARAELIWYVSEPKDGYLELMRKLAHFPHDNDTWLGWGHTMPNGNPPQPLFDGSALDTMLFMHSIVSPDNTLQDEISLSGVPVRFLWLVPITTPECNLKLQHGADELYDVFDKFQHPVVFAGDRASLV